MPAPLIVLIAACGQPALLRRTLQSLAACDKPVSYAGVIVAENGPRAGLAAIVREFDSHHGFRHSYCEMPNKSLALNRALERVGDALVVFTDNDVRALPQTLRAYVEAAAGRGGNEFYGGPIIPDYEAAAPPEWLVPLLPRSAGGLRLDVKAKTQIHGPLFSGPNFAAFAADIRRVGGFDIGLGPGRHMASPGEDTEIQERLLASGGRGYYVPEAAMMHRVPAHNSTLEFAIHRAERNGIYWGISQARRPRFFPRRWLKAYGQFLNDRLRIARWRKNGECAAAARAACLEACWRGRWQGLRVARSWARNSPLPGVQLPGVRPPSDQRQAA
jgi:GT2 family glycosyltransferase